MPFGDMSRPHTCSLCCTSRKVSFVCGPFEMFDTSILRPPKTRVTSLSLILSSRGGPEAPSLQRVRSGVRGCRSTSRPARYSNLSGRRPGQRCRGPAPLHTLHPPRRVPPHLTSPDTSFAFLPHELPSDIRPQRLLPA